MITTLALDQGAVDSYIPHTLREDLNRQEGLPVTECVRIGQALIRALGHLHQCGLVHRDVKPSNVVFVGGIPKLADIGLVASIDATRSMVGTEGYVAPEGPGTPQADLYSLGKMFYEMSTGCDRKEFPALPPDIATRVDRKALIELNAIVTRACQFDPRDRYPTAKAMEKELELLERGHSIQRQRKWQRRWAGFKRARPALAGLGALAVAIALLLRGPARIDRFPDGPPSATSVDANILCTHGMNILRDDRYLEFPQAYSNFCRSVKLDPHFAKPYVGLLELSVREANPDVSGELLDPRLIEGKLRDLAPGLAATYCAQSINRYFDFDFPAAEKFCLLAIEVNPSYELGHSWYSWMLGNWGRPTEALAQTELSYQYLSAKSVVYRSRANSYYAGRDFKHAMEWYHKTLEVEPHQACGFWGIGILLQAQGDYTNAIGNLEAGDLLSERDQASVLAHYQRLRKGLASGGVRGYWEQEWEWELSKPHRHQRFYSKATIQIHLGNTKEAMDWLEKSFASHERDGHETPVTRLLFDDCWEGLRGHPRYQALLKAIGFTKVMPHSPLPFSRSG